MEPANFSRVFCHQKTFCCKRRSAAAVSLFPQPSWEHMYSTYSSKKRKCLISGSTFLILHHSANIGRESSTTIKHQALIHLPIKATLSPLNCDRMVLLRTKPRMTVRCAPSGLLLHWRPQPTKTHIKLDEADAHLLSCFPFLLSRCQGHNFRNNQQTWDTENTVTPNRVKKFILADTCVCGGGGATGGPTGGPRIWSLGHPSGDQLQS